MDEMFKVLMVPLASAFVDSWTMNRPWLPAIVPMSIPSSFHLIEGKGDPMAVHFNDMSDNGIFICSENVDTIIGLDSRTF